MPDMTSRAADVDQLGTAEEFISYYQQEINRNIALIRTSLEKSQDGRSGGRGFDAVINAGHAIGDLAMVYGFEAEEAIGRRIARAAGGDLDKSELAELLLKLETATGLVSEVDVAAGTDSGPAPDTAAAESSQQPDASAERNRPEAAETEAAALESEKPKEREAGDTQRASPLFPELRDHLKDVDEGPDVEAAQDVAQDPEADGRDRLLFDIREDEDLIQTLQSQRPENRLAAGISDLAAGVNEADTPSEAPSNDAAVQLQAEPAGADPRGWDAPTHDEAITPAVQNEDHEPPLLKRIGGFFGLKK